MDYTRNLDGFDQELLLNWFFHHMPMDQRHKLMREHPALYNKACGRTIVRVYLPGEED
jgi:hypothetical protein